MKAVVIHGQPSAGLHELVFRTLGQSVNGILPASKQRLLDIADQYHKIVTSIHDGVSGLSVSNMGTPEDAPTVTDIDSRLIGWGEYQGEGAITWVLELVKPGSFEPIPHTSIHATSFWNFTQSLAKRYPDAPRGIVAWAAYAHKGDKAAFFQTSTKRMFSVELTGG